MLGGRSVATAGQRILKPEGGPNKISNWFESLGVRLESLQQPTSVAVPRTREHPLLDVNHEQSLKALAGACCVAITTIPSGIPPPFPMLGLTITDFERGRGWLFSRCIGMRGCTAVL